MNSIRKKTESTSKNLIKIQIRVIIIQLVRNIFYRIPIGAVFQSDPRKPHSSQIHMFQKPDFVKNPPPIHLSLSSLSGSGSAVGQGLSQVFLHR